MTKDFVLSTLYLRNHTSNDFDLCCTWVKGQYLQKFVSLHISRTVTHMIVVLVPMCKMMISLIFRAFFFFHCFKILIFQLFQSLSTNVPPSSHVCDFSYILVFLKKIVCSENNEIFRINVYFSYQVGLLLVQQWVN